MKIRLLTFLVVHSLCLSNLSFAAARGNSSGGGGDATEMRVNEIRSDILSWISRQGARNLTFPKGITYEDYVKKMTDILEPQKVIVSFTTDAVLVNKEEKTCRGYVDEEFEFHILCNISRFQATTDPGQYRLIHHEYAGLARIEKNLGSASDYIFSDQITEFLQEEKVLRLAIKKPKTVKYFDKSDVWTCESTTEENGVLTQEGKYTLDGKDSVYNPFGSIALGKITNTTEIHRNELFATRAYVERKNNLLSCVLVQNCGKYHAIESSFSTPVPMNQDIVEYTTKIDQKITKTKCSKKVTKELEIKNTIDANSVLKCEVDWVDPKGMKSVEKVFEIATNESLKSVTIDRLEFSAELNARAVVMKIKEAGEETEALTSPLPKKGIPATINRFKSEFAWSVDFKCHVK